MLLAAAGVVCSLAAGDQTGLLGVGLVLLGLGWSAGLVSGSTLVSTGVPVPDGPAVQSLATCR
jgi:hypothetical protein